MKSLRHYQNLRNTLLMAAVLLAAQTLFFWHTHHGHVTPDDACQICLHAQHHTPATNSLPVPQLALFSAVAISQPEVNESHHYVYRITLRSRAPPQLSLT